MLKISTLLALIFSSFLAYSQGCSDAGFCTMGAMRPDQDYNKRINLRLRSIEYNFYEGQTNLSPRILAHTIELNVAVNDNGSIHLKLPYMTVEGNLGRNAGLGDISLSYSRFLTQFKGGEISGTFGFKIPTGNSTQTLANDDPRHLPMYYQTSLGTFDIIGGASWITRDWLVATGIQIPLTANNNQFRFEEWPGYPDQNYLARHDLATNLRRGTDIMLRVEKNFRFVNYNFSIGALPIWRITRDQIQMEDTGEYIKLDNTRGMALSLLLGAGYQFNVRNGVKLIYGHKITDRAVNPDGLTRKHVISFSFIHRF